MSERIKRYLAPATHDTLVKSKGPMSKLTKTITIDFESELERVLRRVARLKAALAHEADITEVPVKECKVRPHTRKAHTRRVITIRGKR